jgi:hypothetical protein
LRGLRLQARFAPGRSRVVIAVNVDIFKRRFGIQSRIGFGLAWRLGRVDQFHFDSSAAGPTNGGPHVPCSQTNVVKSSAWATFPDSSARRLAGS